MKTAGSPRRPVLLVSLLTLLAACAESAPPPDGATIEPLVTTQWLADHLDDPDLVVLDCSVTMERDEEGGLRAVSGRASYENGHIPSAGFADLMGDLSDGDSPLQYAVPTPERFAAVMSALGVDDDSRVVLYDASGSVWAARVWWMLRWIGFDNVAILDGGLQAWTGEGRPLSTDAPRRPAGTLTPSPRPELIADRDEVRAAIDDDAVTLIDAMPAAHYRGEMAMYARPGHIPGAVNVPVTSLTDESGRFLPVEDLAALFDTDPDGRHVTYCGGGIAASATAFNMARLGFTDVAVYTASLQEWAADPANPMEAGMP